MHNWGIDTKELKKSPEKFSIWKLEQMVNFGTDGEKVNAEVLKKYWNKVSLDPAKKKFLGFLLWGKKFLAKIK